MDKQAFLAAYNLTEDDLIKADISWDMICHIYYNYKRLEKDLRDIVKNFIDDYLYEIDVAGIHSYRYRIKDAGHLI